MGLEIKEINELDPAAAIDGSELIELEQASSSVKEDLDTLAAYYLDFLDSYFDFGSDELTILTDLVCNGNLTIDGMILGSIEIQNDLDVNGDLNVDGTITGNMPKFDSGWLLNEMAGAGVADWTNVHLGTDPTDPTDNLTHNLDAPLSELIVKVLLSEDGTDNNSIELVNTGYVYDAAVPGALNNIIGHIIYAVDNNNFFVQTGDAGLLKIENNGTANYINTENWYYKIKVWKLG